MFNLKNLHIKVSFSSPKSEENLRGEKE